MSDPSKPPIWFWLIAVIALLWNALGVIAYLMRAFMNDEVMATLPADQQQYLNELPVWYTIAFAVAVFGGTFGSMMLLLKRAMAYVLFVVSFAAVLVQWSYDLFLVENSPAMDSQGIVMAIMIPLFALGLILFSRFVRSKGWIY